MQTKLNPCAECGGAARIRYRMPWTWVECKKKCGNHTSFYPDMGYDQRDKDSRQLAIDEWNKDNKVKEG